MRRLSNILRALCVAALAVTQATAADITPERLANVGKEPQNWLSFFGNNQGWSYSALGEIHRDNVEKLVPAWTFSTGEKGLGSAPLVVEGVMYLLAPRAQVFALDAATGRLIWTHAHEGPPNALPRPSLGLAAGFGMLFFTTADHHLVAIDMKTGEEVWDVEIEDPEQCGCAPGWSPIMAKDKVIVGHRNEGGHRGYITAFDAKTGKLAWRFFAIPGPGEPGHETWPGELWRTGTASTWYVGSYDAELNLIYWGIGNPGPMLGGNFPGDKLYTESVVAVDADTGKIRWHFQEVPNDKLDYDGVLEPVLFDAEEKGKKRKLLIHSHKGGFAYVLDRVTGEFIRAFPYSDSINWTKGIGEDGKPLEPRLQLSETEVKLVCPGSFGARTSGHSSYNPKNGLWYTSSYEACIRTKAVPSPEPVEGRGLNAGATSGIEHLPGKKPYVAAFDPLTGKKVWTHFPNGPNFSSLLTTAGNLVFGGDIYGDIWALDSESGEKLWAFNAGSGITGAPISYAVNGRQYVAMGAGVSSFALALVNGLFSPEEKAKVPPTGSTLYVFALPETGRRSRK